MLNVWDVAQRIIEKTIRLLPGPTTQKTKASVDGVTAQILLDVC
jgi:hypothetical protein